MRLPTLIFAAALAASPLFSESPADGGSWQRAEIFTTAKDTELRLSAGEVLEFETFRQPLETEGFILLDTSRRFQSFVGVGAAITDSSAETFAKLPGEVQEEFLKAYFDKEEGIGYQLLRTHIASCDFSSAMYDYVEEGDAALASFDVSLDERFRIPMIKRAIEAAGGELPLYASPWSPPAWMKDNGNRLQGGKLLPEFRDSWALHYVKFIEEYEKRGMPIWGLTVQNEPMAVQTWESCVWTAEEERDFVRDNLGPALERAGMSDKKLIVWDHNRDQIYQRATTILGDEEAAKYVWGVGFHWYEPWTGGDMQFYNLRQVAESYPDFKLIFTEGCAERFDAERWEAWELGERYGHSMVNDFKAGTVAWTDWNILLNERGGPNHVGNYCFAPVHANVREGKLVYTNSYYYIGHFSKFIEPGAKRIASSSSRDQVREVAFENPNGEIVLVVLNLTEEAVDYRIMIDGLAAETSILPRAIRTYVLKK